MRQPIKVFVSSTFEDLRHYRGRVIDQLRNLGLYVDPMEHWTSDAQEPKDFSVRRLDGCQLCVLLVAFRRGFIPPGETASITQLEYAAAVARGVAVLPFLLRDDVPAWPPRFCENDPGIRAWRDQLQKSHGVGYFTEQPESLDVGPAVTRWLLERPAPAAPPPAARPADPGWHDLGDFSVRLEGFFDRTAYPATRRATARLLVEAQVRRNNLAAALDVPAEIGLVLDVSGSMRKENRYAMLEQAVAEFVAQLGAKDRASVVVFSSTAEVVSGVASAETLRNNVPALLDRMRKSPALFGAKTNIVPALEKALGLFQASPTAREAVKRLYVLTDGGFHDAAAAVKLLPRVVDLGAELGLYGFGTGVKVEQLQRLLRGQRGGWVKPIVGPGHIVGSFAHIAEVNKALVGQEGRLFIDFDRGVRLGAAWAFRPHERYFGPIPHHRGNCNVGAPEGGRVYSMLFEVDLPPGDEDGSDEHVARIGFVWRNGKRVFEHRRDVAVRREGVFDLPVPAGPDEERVGQAFVILEALRHARTSAAEELELQCARLQIAEYEGRSPDLIRAIQKKIAALRLEAGVPADEFELSPVEIPDFSEEEIELTPAERLLEKACWDSEVRLDPSKKDPVLPDEEDPAAWIDGIEPPDDDEITFEPNPR